MIERLRDILTSAGVRRAVIGLYVALLTVTIAGYMGVSWLRVQTAAYIRGDATLEKSRPNAIRGAVLDASTDRFRRNVDVGFFLLEPRSEEDSRRESAPEGDRTSGGFDGAMLATARPVADGLFQAAFEVPDDVEPGTYDLGLRVQGPGVEPFEAFQEVQVREDASGGVRWPSKTSRISNDERRERLSSGPILSQEGAIAIDVLPKDGELARGLRNRIYLRTYDPETGEPIPARVVFEKVEGMGRWGGRGSKAPDSVQTDELGLAEMKMTPVGGQKWHLRAERPAESPGDDAEGSESARRSGSATIQLHTVATQVAASLRRPIVGGNRRIRGSIESLFQSGNLLVDLYRGRDWLSATQTRLQERDAVLDIEVPEARDGVWLYRVQLARGFYSVGANWESRYVVDTAAIDGDGTRAALETVVGFVDEHRDGPYFEHLAGSDPAPWRAASPAKRQMWLRASLEAIPRHFSRPSTLFNTREPDRKALQKWKRGVKSDLMILIGLGLAGGLAVLLYVVLLGVRRHREHRRQLQQVDDELAAAEFESDLDEEHLFPEGSTSQNLQVVLLGFVALATFAMFAAGVLMLLSYM